VFSVLLQYTDYDCPFGIFNLFVFNYLLHLCHPSCYSFHKHSNKSWMRKGPGSANDKWRYPWSVGTYIFHNGQPSHGGDRNIFEVKTATLPNRTLGSVVLLHALTTPRTRQWGSIRNETLRQKRWFKFSHCKLSIYM
jgi:hypothetical protein